MANENIVTLTQENFEQEVINSDTPVLVDFWAQWCGPCKMVAPVIDEIAEDYNGRIKVAKVNIDDEGELAQQYKIMSIPTMCLFKNGKIVNELVGVQPKKELVDFIEKVI